jgi:hypothetical protein
MVIATTVVLALPVVEGSASAGATDTARAKAGDETGDETGAWSATTPEESSGERAALV